MVLASPLLAVALVFATPALAEEEAAKSAWLQDFAAAQEKAKAENKDLLIDFTGSDWCVWCQRLDSEVFQADGFEGQVQEQFVLVKLDFPNDKSLVTEEIQKQNKGLMARYGVQGFPTIFLTDAAGTPYAKTGYERGGAENYLKHLAEKREAKSKFAEAVAGLAAHQGVEKAKKIDEALSIIDSELIFPFYVSHVDEILTLDAAGEAGLAKKYSEMKSAYLERVAMMELNETVGPYFESQDWDNALKAIDEFVAKYKGTMPSVAQQAMMAKVGVFMQQKKYDDAIGVVEQAKAFAPDSEIGAQADMIIAQIKMMAEQAKEGGDEEHSDDDGHDHGSDGDGN